MRRIGRDHQRVALAERRGRELAGKAARLAFELRVRDHVEEPMPAREEVVPAAEMFHGAVGYVSADRAGCGGALRRPGAESHVLVSLFDVAVDAPPQVVERFLAELPVQPRRRVGRIAAGRQRLAIALAEERGARRAVARAEVVALARRLLVAP